MTSKELTDNLMTHVSVFLHEKGTIGDALGALKMVEMSLEMSFASSFRREQEAEE